MVFIKDVSGNADAGTATQWGGNDINVLDDYFDNIDISPKAPKINTLTAFRSGKFSLRDSDDTHSYIFLTGNLTANRNISLPVLTGDDTLVTVGTLPVQLQFDYIIRKDGSNTIAYNTATKTDQYTSTDARTTFQNVVSALNSAGGGSCFVKKGTYTMVNVNDTITMQNNQNWVGEDRDLTILLNQSTTRPVWERTGSPLTEFKMANMTITSAGAGAMIYTSGSLDSTFENMYFVYTSPPASPSIMTFFDNVLDAQENRRLTIKNCKWEGDANGEDQLGCGGMYGCDVSHNMFLNSSGQGIGCGGAVGSKFNDNYFFKVGTNPIGFESTATIHCEGNEVCRNVTVSCGGQIKLSQEGFTAKSINNICCNNTIQYTQGGGIEDGWGEGDIICGNVFRRTGTYGIRGTLSHCIVTDNIFYETNTSDSDFSGINYPAIVLSNNTNFTTPGASTIDRNYFYTARANFTVPTGYTDGGNTKQGYLGGIFIDTNFTGVIIGSDNYYDNIYNTVTDNGSKTQVRKIIVDGTDQVLGLHRTDNSAGDLVKLNLNADSSTNIERTYASIEARIASSTNGAEDGWFQIRTIQGGTLIQPFTIYHDGTLGCGGANRRVEFKETGLTGTRGFTFPDTTTQLAGVGVSNTFTEPQTIKKNTALLATLWRDSNTLNDTIEFNLDGKDNAGSPNQTTYGKITAKIIDNTDGSEDGNVEISIIKAGTVSSVGRFDENGRFQCGGTNKRIQFDDATLTGDRIIRFADIGTVGGTNPIVKIQSHDYFEAEDEFNCGSISLTNTSNSIGVLGWAISNSTGGTPTVTAGVANHPGIVTITTGSTSGNNCRMHLTDAAATAFCLPTDIERYAWIVRIPTITSIIVRVGLMQDVSAANGGTAGAFFQFSSAVDADNWQSITRQASTSTTNTITGVTVDAGDWFLLEAVRLSGGNWEFYVNNTLQFTHSTNLPTTACNIGVHTETATTAARPLDIDYFKIRTIKLGQRWT